MLNSFRGLLFLICLILWQSVAFSQRIYFEHPKDAGQFLRGTILDVIQDQQGFLWIATTDGLGRYDGRSVVEYRNVRNDTGSLSNNFTSDLFEDTKGRIWIATKYGLNCYIPEFDQFIRYYYEGSSDRDERNYILSVTQDKFGIIWYSTYGGVFSLDPETGSKRLFVSDSGNPKSLIHNVIWDIFEDSKGALWFGANNGISTYRNDGSFSFTRMHSGDDELGLEDDRIYSFAEQSNGTLWIGGNNGLYKTFRKDEGVCFVKVKARNGKTSDAGHCFVNKLWAEGDERLWVCTWAQGLLELDLGNEMENEYDFKFYRSDPNDQSSISINNINTVMKDRTGVLWAGTSAGLDKYAPTLWKFDGLTPIQNDSLSLSSKIIKSIHFDSRGNLWIGTLNGVNFLSAEDLARRSYRFRIFRHEKDNPKSISHNNIFGMCSDSNGVLWISSYNGLNYVYPESFGENPVFHKLTEKDGLPSNWVFDIYPIRKGSYWISTYGGLARLDFDPEQPEEKKIKNYVLKKDNDSSLVNSLTYQVCEDKFGRYWVGTFLGLSKYLEEGDCFENYKSDPGNPGAISDNSIICLFKDSKERLWVGTRNGLNYVVQDNEYDSARFIDFGIKDAFPNSVIQSIVEDEDGKLWIGTNRGLVHFDPDSAIEGKSPVIRSYDIHDGLLASGFIFRSAGRSKNGTLYFGTSNGLVYFNPAGLIQNKNRPEIVFTGLKILNRNILPVKGKDGILQKSINYTDRVQLKHWQNMLIFEFAAMDFSNPVKNKYQYELEGFDRNWIHSGYANTATYTNVPPGDYVFKVVASNNDGYWNEEPARLQIRIFPPWWKTQWAYFLYVLLFAALVYAFISFKVRQKMNKIRTMEKIKATRLEERELLRKKNAADFHDELGHRLTKVSLYLELAEREVNKDSYLSKIIGKIRKNSSGLSDGVRDLIWTLDPDKDSLYETLVRLQEFGDSLFDFGSIHFKSERIDEKFMEVRLSPDMRKHILLLFKEAMHNCLKYSKAENAKLDSRLDGEHIVISFKDDGIGFDLYNHMSGYGLENMKLRSAKMGAELVISAAIDEGVEIVLDIPFIRDNSPLLG